MEPLQLLQRHVLLDPDMVHAHRALGAPARLEVLPFSLIRSLNLPRVVDVDEHAVTRGGVPVAAVVGAHHAYAGVVEDTHRPAVGARLPGAIPKADALGLGAAGAGELEDARLGLDH